MLKEKWNLIRGFFFVNGKGNRLTLKDMEVDILDRIAAIQNKYPELIGVRVDVYDEYRLSRSFRRGSNSEALNRGVKEEVIDRNNRWRKEERAGARKAKLKMRDHYTDVIVALKSYMQYSQAL